MIGWSQLNFWGAFAAGSPVTSLFMGIRYKRALTASEQEASPFASCFGTDSALLRTEEFARTVNRRNRKWSYCCWTVLLRPVSVCNEFVDIFCQLDAKMIFLNTWFTSAYKRTSETASALKVSVVHVGVWTHSSNMSSTMNPCCPRNWYWNLSSPL